MLLKKEVKGNRNIVIKEIKINSFISFHIAAIGLIELHQSDNEKLVIETDENLHEYFDISNAGDTLYVITDVIFKQIIFTTCKIKFF